jgi:hypothetical protein
MYLFFDIKTNIKISEFVKRGFNQVLGKEVMFQGDVYIVIYDYKNEMIEIRKKGGVNYNNQDVKLVRRTEIEVVKGISKKE